MIHGRRRTVGMGMAALVAVAVLVSGAPTAAQQPTPTLVVTPDTDLLDAQVVTVTGSGFLPNVNVWVSMCTPGAPDVFGCDQRQIRQVAADGSGGFSLDYPVGRFVLPAFPDPGATPTDCAQATCSVGATDIFSGGTTTLLTPVTFADVPPDDPDLAVTPAEGLVDGQVVGVTGSGLHPGSTVQLARCLPGATGPTDCQSQTVTAVVDGSGQLSTAIAVARYLSFPTPTDCLVAACTIGVSSLSGFHQVDIAFVDPGLEVTIAEAATLQPATNEVVGRATVACELPTPVSVVADIRQPGVHYRYVLVNQTCTPTEPLLAFLPSRIPWEEGSFVPGSVDIEVRAHPLRSSSGFPPASATTTEVAEVPLLDHDDVVATVTAALEDPANAGLRELVERDIRLRVAQDPVFRDAFAALLRGGT